MERYFGGTHQRTPDTIGLFLWTCPIYNRFFSEPPSLKKNHSFHMTHSIWIMFYGYVSVKIRISGPSIRENVAGLWSPSPGKIITLLYQLNFNNRKGFKPSVSALNRFQISRQDYFDLSNWPEGTTGDLNILFNVLSTESNVRTYFRLLDKVLD